MASLFQSDILNTVARLKQDLVVSVQTSENAKPPTHEFEKSISHILDELSELTIDVTVLTKTKIGVAVEKLSRGSFKDSLKAKAQILVGKWRTVVLDHRKDVKEKLKLMSASSQCTQEPTDQELETGSSGLDSRIEVSPNGALTGVGQNHHREGLTPQGEAGDIGTGGNHSTDSPIERRQDVTQEDAKNRPDSLPSVQIKQEPPDSNTPISSCTETNTSAKLVVDQKAVERLKSVLTKQLKIGLPKETPGNKEHAEKAWNDLQTSKRQEGVKPAENNSLSLEKIQESGSVKQSSTTEFPNKNSTCSAVTDRESIVQVVDKIHNEIEDNDDVDVSLSKIAVRGDQFLGTHNPVPRGIVERKQVALTENSGKDDLTPNEESPPRFSWLGAPSAKGGLAPEDKLVRITYSDEDDSSNDENNLDDSCDEAIKNFVPEINERNKISETGGPSTDNMENSRFEINEDIPESIVDDNDDDGSSDNYDDDHSDHNLDAIAEDQMQGCQLSTEKKQLRKTSANRKTIVDEMSALKSKLADGQNALLKIEQLCFFLKSSFNDINKQFEKLEELTTPESVSSLNRKKKLEASKTDMAKKKKMNTSSLIILSSKEKDRKSAGVDDTDDIDFKVSGAIKEGLSHNVESQVPSSYSASMEDELLRIRATVQQNLKQKSSTTDSVPGLENEHQRLLKKGASAEQKVKSNRSISSSQMCIKYPVLSEVSSTSSGELFNHVPVELPASSSIESSARELSPRSKKEVRFAQNKNSQRRPMTSDDIKISLQSSILSNEYFTLLSNRFSRDQPEEFQSPLPVGSSSTETSRRPRKGNFSERDTMLSTVPTLVRDESTTNANPHDHAKVDKIRPKMPAMHLSKNQKKLMSANSRLARKKRMLKAKSTIENQVRQITKANKNKKLLSNIEKDAFLEEDQVNSVELNGDMKRRRQKKSIPRDVFHDPHVTTYLKPNKDMKGYDSKSSRTKTVSTSEDDEPIGRTLVKQRSYSSDDDSSYNLPLLFASNKSGSETISSKPCKDVFSKKEKNRGYSGTKNIPSSPSLSRSNSYPHDMYSSPTRDTSEPSPSGVSKANDDWQFKIPSSQLIKNVTPTKKRKLDESKNVENDSDSLDTNLLCFTQAIDFMKDNEELDSGDVEYIESNKRKLRRSWNEECKRKKGTRYSALGRNNGQGQLKALHPESVGSPALRRILDKEKKNKREGLLCKLRKQLKDGLSQTDAER